MTVDKKYNPSEEDTFRKSLFQRMDSQDLVLSTIMSDVKLTKEQAYKTNGRVNKLEWSKGGIIWFIGVLLALSIPIIDLIKYEIRTTVVGILSDYNIVKSQ